MNHHLLRVGLAGQPPRAQEWEMDLPSRGIVVLRAGNLKEATSYCRAYPLMAVMVDIPQVTPEMIEAIQALRQTPPPEGRAPSILGLATEQLPAEECAQLAQAGLDNLLSLTSPVQFLLYHLNTLVNLSELKSFEQSRQDVVALANSTRERLHELSQPLSAIQGRLQLLAAKCPNDDANFKTYNDMVRMAFDITHQVMEIQQLHRKYS